MRKITTRSLTPGRRWLVRGGALLAGASLASAPLVGASVSAHAATGWDAVAQCESGGDPTYNDGQFYGLYNFDKQTWQGLGYSGTADQYSASVQTRAAEELYAQRGAQPWPICGKYLSGGADTTAPTATQGGATHSTVSRGEQGTLLGAWLVKVERRDVARIQRLLQERGQQLVIDGRYGPRTAAAVREIQRQAGISVDGVYGPQTRGVLVG